MHDEAIARELVVMAERDQAMRRQAAADGSASGGIFDRPHAERLREIISRIGWPTRSRRYGKRPRASCSVRKARRAACFMSFMTMAAAPRRMCVH